ncbi:MAG TPA: PH domain-containing protein [Solirubrobacteraceae bacterium]|nr:PH domain-containing protein [Solirubrobacteraceae bacterium]
MAMIFVPGWVAATVIVIERIPSPLATLLVIVLPGWVLAWMVVRAGWTGVQVNDHGVRIRNQLRTRDIPWAEIERFSVGTAGIFPAVGLVHLTDGSTVPIFGIQPRNVVFFPNDDSALDLVAQLEAVRVARTVAFGRRAAARRAGTPSR